MTRTAEQILADAEARQIRIERAQIMCDQIGAMNLMAICGGRVVATETGITMPCGNGYRVEVDLDEGRDLYNVRRVFVRAGKVTEHGKVEGVYCDDLGELAYFASCYRSYDATEWMVQG